MHTVPSFVPHVSLSKTATLAKAPLAGASTLLAWATPHSSSWETRALMAVAAEVHLLQAIDYDIEAFERADHMDGFDFIAQLGARREAASR